ncbi:MAG: hypothetical protein AAGF48_12880 [Pseudomonadota bacterium]
MRLIAFILASLIGTAALAQEKVPAPTPKPVESVATVPTGLSIQKVQNGIKEGVKVGDGVHVANLGAIFDEEATDTPKVTFTLSGNDATSFEVRDGNQLWFIAGTPDYETKAEYGLKISGGGVTAGYKLPVFDVKEATVAYRWHKDSKLFVGPEKVPTGAQGEMLIAKRTTLVKPPSVDEGKWPQWNDKTEAWDVVDLHVGKTVYSKDTKAPMQVEFRKHGNVIPEGFTDVAPPDACEFCEWDKTKKAWAENTVKKDAAADVINRITALRTDPGTKPLRDKLRNATPEQIATYVKGQVKADEVKTNAEAIAAIKKLERAVIEMFTIMAADRQTNEAE